MHILSPYGIVSVINIAYVKFEKIMDIIFIAINVILAQSQPLLVFLGLSGSVVAVQLAVIATAALSAIALTFGILGLMMYGLKKINKKDNGISEEEEEEEVISENEAEISPKALEIIKAQQALEAAQESYKAVLDSKPILKNRIPEYLNAQKEWDLAVLIARKKVKSAEKKIKSSPLQNEEDISSENETEVIEYEAYVPQVPANKSKSNSLKKVAWILPPENEANDFLEDEIEIVDTPEIISAREKLKTAKDNYATILAKETEVRKSNLSNDYLKFKDDKYWSCAREDAARDKVQIAEEALEKLIFAQKIKPKP